MFFFGNKKLTIPPFSLGVFGKLPFYKDFLYSGFGPEFAELKMFFDTGIDQLHRSGKKGPYVQPARNFYLFMDHFQNDLVGCVWDSHDGLRTFPFIIAAPVPRKIRKEKFPMFWTVLTQFWGYLGETFQELASRENPTDFYQLVKGSKHQLNSISQPDWEETQSKWAIQAGMNLNDGLMAQVPLFEMNDLDIDSFLKALHLEENPAMILWPRAEWRSHPNVLGYLGTIGFDELRISFFPPPEQDENIASTEEIHSPVQEEPFSANQVEILPPEDSNDSGPQETI